MSTTQRDLPLTPLQATTPFPREVWASIFPHLDSNSFVALFLTNKALNDLLVIKMIELELLFPQSPNDRRTPFQYLAQESSKLYRELKEKYPLAYTMTWAALYQDFRRFEKALREFKNVKGDKWRERLQVEKAPRYPLVRIIMERGNREFFDLLYVENKFPINMRFSEGNSALSYALIYNVVGVADWLLAQPELEIDFNDLTAAIIGPHENVDLFTQILKRCKRLKHNELLSALITAIEEKKDQFVRCLGEYGVSIGFDVTKMVDEYSKEQDRFELIYHFHRCVGTLPEFSKLNLPACTVVSGNMPSDTAQALTNRTHYGSLLRIATLYSPRDKVVELVKKLLAVNVFDVADDFREGKLIQSLLEQPDTPFELLRILIDASAKYYDQMPPNESSLYRRKLMTTLLSKCEQGFKHYDTLRLARQMIRRWGPQLRVFFSEKELLNPARYGGRVTGEDLRNLSLYYKHISQITDALIKCDTKRLKHYSGEISREFRAIAEDIIERNIGVGSNLTGFEKGMVEDAQSSTPRFEVTHRFLNANQKEGLTPRNIVDRLIARKRTIFRTYVGWEFVLEPEGLKVLREHPEFQSISALTRWVELYCDYEKIKSGSAHKVAALEMALSTARMHFPKDLYDPKQLLEFLKFNDWGLRNAIWLHRYLDGNGQQPKGHPKGWDKLLECFPVLANYLKLHPEELECASPKFVPQKRQEAIKVVRQPSNKIPVSKGMPMDQDVLQQQRRDDEIRTTSFSY